MPLNDFCAGGGWGSVLKERVIEDLSAGIWRVKGPCLEGRLRR